jgi:uncharacterized protein (DUF2147 family)
MRRGQQLLLGALALAVGACASASMAPPTVDVTGKWKGTWTFENAAVGGGDVLMDLKQTGPDASGNLTVTGPTSSKPAYMEGTVSGSTLILKGIYLSGTLAVNGDEMKGVVNGIMPAIVTVRRQK